MEHPFLHDASNIPWSRLTPSAVEPDIRKALADAEHAVEAIASRDEDDAETLDYASTFGALDEALETLSAAWGKVSHLDAVCNSEALRQAHNAMLPAVTDFFASIPLNDRLWNVLKTYGESGAAAELSPARQRHVRETMADFREQGADLPAEQKERVRAIQGELAEKTQKFSENVLDGTNAWETVVDDAERLAGLPESARDAAFESARDKGYATADAPAWRFTLQAPSLIPLLTHAEDESLRREAWDALNRLGSEPPHDNRQLVRDIIARRQELAGLIGRDDFADLVTERRMVGSGAQALAFVDGLHDRVAETFRDEADALRAFKADATGGEPEPLEPWEASYWAEKRRRAKFDFDEEELRPYFPIDQVLDGLFRIAETVFRLTILERATAGPGRTREDPDAVEVWHDEVRFFDVMDESGRHLGSFYADWHPRESKRGGAWFNPLRTGQRSLEGESTPHLGVICGNLTPSVGGKPALLTHDEALTIFHEFGHLLHHLCGEVEVKSLNGVNVPWDFVELPSQLMENWCWERESLDLFARHHETGDVIPDELFEKMTAARNHLTATSNMRQLSFAKLDLELHITWGRNPGDDLDAFMERAIDDFTPDYKTPPRPHTYRFSHLFAGPTGYAAGYYSYKWAEVLDADAFTRFQAEGVMNPEVGRAFRQTVLARGNSAEPSVLFHDFMGRDPDPDALLRRDGLL